MNWIKKIGIAAAAICLLGIPAYAANITVSNETGAVNAIGTASYSASVTNNGSEAVEPIIVIARYENDMLVAAKCNSLEIAAGGTEVLSEELTGATVTDSTRISGFIWDGRSLSIPVALTEIEKKGSKDISISSLNIAGTEAGVDNDSKSITAYVPLYDSMGMQLMTDVEVSATLGSSDGKISIGNAVLNGETELKEGKADFSSVPTVKVTSGEGDVAEYTLKLYRTFEDDFDNGSLFTGATAGVVSPDGNLTWKAATADSGLVNADGETQFGGLGDFATALSITKNQNWRYGVNEALANEVAAGIDLGIANISDGLFSANSLSYESGNALRIAKRVARRNEGQNADTPAPFFDIKIAGGSEMLVYEFDMAFDYSRCRMEPDSVINYCVGSSSAGIRVLSDNDSVGTDICGNQSLESSDSRANGFLVAAATKASLNKWHHIKMIYTPEKCDMYIDDMVTPYKSVSISKWPTALRIFTSTMRACEVYLDNLKIVYDVR